MKSLYVGSLRTWLRRLGIVYLVSIPARAKNRRRLADYARSRPSRVDVRVANAKGVMLVDDAVEYSRVMSYEDDRHILTPILERLKPGDSYWDVGASIGLYSILTADAVGPDGTIVAFEPEPRSYQRLSENVAANGLSNVRLMPVALGGSRCTMQILAAEHASLGNHKLVAVEAGSGGTATATAAHATVDVVPGDELRGSAGLPVPAAVKIDVEGAEEDVMFGMKDTLADPACRTLVCEVHFSILQSSGRGEVPNRITKLLPTLGFHQLTWLDPSHLLACK